MAGQSRMFLNKHVAKDIERKLLFYAKKTLFCDPRSWSAIALTPSTLFAYPQCFMAQENGLSHKVCSTRCVPGGWVNYVASFAFENNQMRAGLIKRKERELIVAKQLKKHNQLKIQKI